MKAPEDPIRSFEDLLIRLSSRFVAQPADQLDGVIERALEELVTELGYDRSSLGQYVPPGSRELWVTHSWAKDGLERLGRRPAGQLSPALADSLRSGEEISFSGLDSIEDREERATAAAMGLRAFLFLPVRIGGEVVGFLEFSARLEVIWSRALVTRLRLLSELFGSALVRQRDAIERRRSEAEIQRLARRLEAENIYFQEEIRSTHGFDGIIGESLPMKAALYKVEQVATTDAPVLILGETGTGKELFSRAVHEHSRRSDRPLVKVNCAALPASLIESELFGHVKGAFTGATTARVGRFQLAHGGTLFLDEIGDLELTLQAKLLRVLQEGEYEAVGSSTTVHIDVRVIAATNRDLEEAIRQERFRRDLYYRLNVFPIEIPPLRERSEDIRELAQSFIGRGNRRLGRQVERVTAADFRNLESHSWPGNVRELQNVIDRALILSRGGTLALDDFEPATEKPGPPGRLDETARHHQGMTSKRTLADVEREHIVRTLEACGWKINGPGNAAETLDLHPSTLRFRMKKLGIQRTSGALVS